tara:strand:+ start:572 stop:688 length:117 start_codon:yes stop_codon:yes gene_type:complete
LLWGGVSAVGALGCSGWIAAPDAAVGASGANQVWIFIR